MSTLTMVLAQPQIRPYRPGLLVLRSWNGSLAAQDSIVMQDIRRFIGLMLFVLLAGCNRAPNTVSLCGSIVIDDQPVRNGRIDFLPIDGTPGASAGAAIVDGRYQIPASFGVRADGIYLVRIIGLRKTGRIGMNRSDTGEGKQAELQENFIPAIYNSQSTQKLLVADQPDRSNVDFRLEANATAAHTSF